MKQRLFSLLLILFAVTGLGYSYAETDGLVTAGLSVRYNIYFYSEDGAEMNTRYGSYLQFKLQPGVGATYDYFINDSLHVTGRVGGYQEKESEVQYQLDGFFNKGKANAVLRIVDLPDADNIKAAVLYYANKEDDSAQTYYQYILLTEM
jgi:hypothetical protein